MSTLVKFVSGDPVFGKTAMDVIQKDPEDRFREVDRWISVLRDQVKDFLDPSSPVYHDEKFLDGWTYEAYVHAMTALYATKEMKGRPAVKWDGNTFWEDWMKEAVK